MKLRCSLVPIFKGDFVLYVCAIFTKKRTQKWVTNYTTINKWSEKRDGKKIRDKKKINKHFAPTQ